MTSFTARALSTNRLQQIVTKAGHGFVIGDVVSFDGVDWELSLASSIFLSQGTCMVSLVLDVNTFVVTQVGHVVNITDPSISPLNVGAQYYVSPTLPGALTITSPSTVGQVINPCFVSDTTTSGFFFGGTGTIVQASGSTFPWSVVGANTAMLINHGYFTSSGGTLNMTLPAASAIGDTIRISNLAGNFHIVQGAGQSVGFGDDITTPGAGGSVTSTLPGDTLELICYNANVGFQVTSSMGNLTIV